MALCIPKREIEPGTRYFKPVWCARYLNARMNEFAAPAGLICWWRTQKVQKRLWALPESWCAELVRRYENRLDALNNLGG